MLANGWPAAGPKNAAVTHWGGDHASRVLPFAAGCGFEAYPDDESWDTREESILERRSRLNAARQSRVSDLLEQITPSKDDSLEARQRRLFQIDVKSRPRSAAPKKDYAIYGPALLDVSDDANGPCSVHVCTEEGEWTLIELSAPATENFTKHNRAIGPLGLLLNQELSSETEFFGFFRCVLIE